MCSGCFTRPGPAWNTRTWQPLRTTLELEKAPPGRGASPRSGTIQYDDGVGDGVVIAGCRGESRRWCQSAREGGNQDGRKSVPQPNHHVRPIRP
jgi:hypothetical protein